MAYLTDIEIAQQCEMKPITDIAKKAHVDEKYIEQYGKYKAKVDPALLNEVKGSFFQSIHGGLNVAVTRDENHGALVCWAVRTFQLAQYFDAVYFRHFHIGIDKVVFAFLGFVQALPSAFRQVHGMTFELKYFFQRVTDCTFIVYD